MAKRAAGTALNRDTELDVKEAPEEVILNIIYVKMLSSRFQRFLALFVARHVF